MSDDSILVELDNVHHRFGNAEVVRGVSFQVRRGEILGFLGPNGAGKSTTMNILTGALSPTAGTVRVGGFDLLRQPLEVKRRLGYLPEIPPLYRDLTVDEYLRFCGRLRGVARDALARALEQAKRRTGLTKMSRRLIGQLSKGYQQRVGIAQAIIHDPAVVVLDEPTVGLDPLQIQEIRDLISELGARHSVILSTHILSEVQTICSHVQIIDRGQIVLAAPIAELGGRMAAQVLVIGLSRPPAEDRLRALPGVSRVEILGDGRWLLELAPDVAGGSAAAAERIAASAVADNWGLRELTPRRASLEEIFTRLVSDEPVRSAAA